MSAQNSNSPKLGGIRAWLIFSLAAISFGYAFIHRVAPGVMVDELMQEFAIGGAVVGILSALYFYPYVLLQIPLGALLDRLGPRIILGSALLLATGGSIAFGFADTIFIAYIGRFLIGVGCAAGFLSALTLAGRWFPPNQFALLSGLTMFVAMMSAVLGQAPLAVLVNDIGWRQSTLALGVFGSILAIIIFAFVRSSPAGAEVRKAESWGSMWHGLGRAMTSANVWKIAFVASAMSGPMLTLGGLWGTPYLMNAYGLSKEYAAFLVSLIFFGWAFGAPSAGWLSDRLQRRKIILVAGSAVMTIVLMLLITLPTAPLWLTVSLLAITGASGGCMACSFALVRETSPVEISGSVTGIVNSLTVASGALLQPIVGWLLDLQWDGRLVDGSRIYQPEDFRVAFLVVMAIGFLGFLISLTLKDTPKP